MSFKTPAPIQIGVYENCSSHIKLEWTRLLKSYLPKVEAYGAKADVWVIDNGSTDQSLTYLAQSHPNVKTVALDKNYGFAKGYNQGLKI